MSSILLDLSGRIDKLTIDVLRVVSNVAQANGINFFVIGAVAREIVLEQGYGIEPHRKTNDVDLAVMVADWQQYEWLIAALEESGEFHKTRVVHRLSYANILPIDLIPFGPISSGDNEISWPPEYEISLKLIGFEESYANCLPVKLSSEPELVVNFVSPVGWTLLKLFSWRERGQEDNRDAKDLAIVLKNYAELGNLDRLYEEEIELLEAENYDQETAGARLLGRDLASIAGRNRDMLLEFLGSQTIKQERYPLIEAMVNNRIANHENFERYHTLLGKLEQGVWEGKY